MQTNSAPNEYQVSDPRRALSRLTTAFPPLAAETRSHVDTATAAWHLNREQQTLRIWACRENGPLRPQRVNGRLAWPVDEIKRVLGVG